MAATSGGSGGKVNSTGTFGNYQTAQSDQVVLLVGAVVGFFLVPPLARANPVLVNGFLLLVVFSVLLIRRDRWLPYLDQLSKAA